MANPEHLSKLKEGVEAWNQWREENPAVLPDLKGADLSWTDLRRVNFYAVDLSEADLREADLSYAVLYKAELSGTDLSAADLFFADLREADLCESNLMGLNLSSANLNGATLRAADLREAELCESNLRDADLSVAYLRGANLFATDISSADLSGADLSNCMVSGSLFSDVDLSNVKGLGTIEHRGPSSIGIDTIKLSEGRIPDDFLRGCGVSPWEIEIVRLYNPDLTPSDVDEILGTRIYQKRVAGPLFIGGIFISYSHHDGNFVDKLYKELKSSDLSVWFDKHDMLAGNIERQVMRQIRIKDVVVLVLSESSIKSDWVETELEEAREKEKAQDRDVLCPIAIDDSWKGMEGVLWRKLKRDKHILDFSAWKTEEEFKRQFDKLIRGMQINY